ncbi:MAG TPA: outer membrane beta-barrel domain-containing protein, partial [Dissulfurispiraceae bacterium]|nr:outer membrane beta-barrel domain-containing protein [Dissulfurispiraceae bacterium]
MKKYIVLLALLAVALMPLYASAEIKEGSVELNPFIGGILHDGGENLRVAPVFGLRVGYNFTKNIGIEGAVDYYRARIRDKSISPEDLRFGNPNSTVKTLLYHVDAIYHFMPDQNFVPFIVGGIGGANFNPNATGSKNKLMANLGVGAKYWLTDATALRFDVRDVAYFGSIKQNVEATLGLVIALGGKGKAAPAPVAEPAPAPAPAPKPEPKQEIAPAAKAAPAPVVLEDVHFDFDKATLTDAAKAILKKNIAVIKANPGIAVRIEGNTCQHGTDEYNMRLG